MRGEEAAPGIHRRMQHNSRSPHQRVSAPYTMCRNNCR